MKSPTGKMVEDILDYFEEDFESCVCEREVNDIVRWFANEGVTVTPSLVTKVATEKFFPVIDGKIIYMSKFEAEVRKFIAYGEEEPTLRELKIHLNKEGYWFNDRLLSGVLREIV